MLVEEYFINDVYTKAKNALEDSFILKRPGVDMFKVADEIRYHIINFVNDDTIRKNIVLNFDLNEDLKSLKNKYVDKYLIK